MVPSLTSFTWCNIETCSHKEKILFKRALLIWEDADVVFGCCFIGSYWTEKTALLVRSKQCLCDSFLGKGALSPLSSAYSIYSNFWCAVVMVMRTQWSFCSIWVNRHRQLGELYETWIISGPWLYQELSTFLFKHLPSYVFSGLSKCNLCFRTNKNMPPLGTVHPSEIRLWIPEGKGVNESQIKIMVGENLSLPLSREKFLIIAIKWTE